MSIQLTNRVSTLEAEVKALRETVDGLIEAMTQPPEQKNPNGPRTLCPKCGLVPNYFLHTRSCRGKKQVAAI